VIDEAEFRRLTVSCDALLQRSDSTPERVAIPWLHVLHGHPAQCEQYQDLFGAPDKFGWKKLRDRMRGVLNGVRSKIKAAPADGSHWQPKCCLPSGSDVLFITHRVSSSHDEIEEDFYFGDLPWQLADRGMRVVMAAIDHASDEGDGYDVPVKAGGVPRVRLATGDRAPLEEEFQRRQENESARLAALSKELRGFDWQVAKRAAFEARGEGARAALRIGHQIGELAARTKPRNILAINEGHAWERLAFSRAREAVPEVRCMGYHHAVIFPWHHALKRQLAPKYNPDRIFTAGEISCDALRNAERLDEIPVDILGTNKAPTGHQKSVASAEPVCLVVPEGIPDECTVLFEFALQCARENPGWKFIFRSHPVMPFRAILGQVKGWRERPANVERSERAIEEDFQRSRWTLYRGSGAVVQAVLAGLKPFYFAKTDELNFNPIHQAGSWQETVTSPGEFRAGAVKDLGDDIVSRTQSEAQALAHCQRIFQPLNVETLASVIANPASAGSEVPGH
tara:strand:+ start:35418 stop:36947 length:1530 start_codon:yes stop_codon:yes gene_type:complete